MKPKVTIAWTRWMISFSCNSTDISNPGLVFWSHGAKTRLFLITLPFLGGYPHLHCLRWLLDAGEGPGKGRRKACLVLLRSWPRNWIYPCIWCLIGQGLIIWPQWAAKEAGKCSFYIYPTNFPGGSDGKVAVCNAVDPGSIPGSGRSPGEGDGNPLQYHCLENPMDRGA